jgi:uncharacterized membrane protein
MRSKIVVRIAIIAALYVVFTLALAPVGFGPVQFRVSEALKVFVLLNPFYALGIGLGTLIANLASPYAGPWDLVFMPVTDIIGGFVAWGLYRMTGRRWIAPALSLYAATTALAVGVMLAAFGLGAWYAAALPVLGSELIILLVGGPILWRALGWINQR